VTDWISVSVPRPLTQRAILVSVALGGMLVPLNSTMIAVALPNIMREFGADVNAAGWLVTAYLITMATFQLIAGKLGDQFGRRALLLGGLIYWSLPHCAWVGRQFRQRSGDRAKSVLTSWVRLPWQPS